MTRRQKWIVLYALGTYPALSILDAMFETMTGMSFFYRAGPEDAARLAAPTRALLTIALGYATFMVALLVKPTVDAQGPSR